MSHLGERVADYLVGEMTDSEAAEAAEHIRQCSDCSRQVDAFKRTLAMLQAVPDREPPRPLVFEVERKRERPAWLWRWVSPVVAAVAASIVTAVLISHPRVEPLQQSSQAWVASELEKRDLAHAQELEQLRTEVAFWERQQRAATREMFETGRSIQQLAQASLRRE